MADEAPPIVESYWDRLNLRLRDEGLTQQFKAEDQGYTYPAPRNEREWKVFLEILKELSV